MVVLYVFKRYLFHFARRPWTANIITTGITFVIGDFVSQKCIEKKPYNFKRAAKLFGIGTLVVAPMVFCWFKVLDKVVKATTLFASLKKVLIDQLVFSPFIISIMFTITNFSDGKNSDQLVERFRRDYYSTLMSSYQFWPFVQIFNFTLVPTVYRILVVRFASLFWNTYISFVLFSERKIEDFHL
nr:protein Mpv17 [Hydra vulgaris]